MGIWHLATEYTLSAFRDGEKSEEACPHKDANGFCHQSPETNYDDKVGQTTIRIPDRPGHQDVGPPAGNNEPTEECDKGRNQ